MKTEKYRVCLENELNKSVDLQGKEIIIYGAGNTSLLYEECFIKEEVKIVAFADGNPEKIGTSFLGKEVISLDMIKERFSCPLIMIVSGNINTCNAIRKNLEGKYEYCFFDEYVFAKHKESVLQVFDLLEDELSKQIYKNMILARMGREEIDLSLVSEDSYFALNEFALYSASEVFVDCGAYVGDTLERYLFKKSGIFGKVYAFEPEPRNYRALMYRTERLNREWALGADKITLVDAGVGEKTQKLFLGGQGTDTGALGANLSEEPRDAGNTVKVFALDDYFAEEKITFLKADIESFETKMLKGAERLIQRDKPRMALCIYHNANDMYQIALMIDAWKLGYRFAVRQHYGNLCETVLYVY